MMGLIASGLAGLARVMRMLTASLLVVSVLLNFANIFGRYFLNAPLQWGEEVMLFLMVGIVFFGAVVISAQGRHIRMDILVALLPVPAQRAFAALAILAEGIAAAVVVCIGVPVVMELADFDQRADASNVPLYIPQAIVPVGMSLIALICVARLVLLLAGRRTTAVLPSAVAEPAPLAGE
jgi:TRAP-type C4-dicarboxylate transport system permease small subunit